MSITYELFQDTIIYPPAPGDPGGPCLDERCGHFDCHRMRKDAATLCPICQQPTGYGNAMHMKPIVKGEWRDGADGRREVIQEDSGFRDVTNEHEACYQARLELAKSDAIDKQEAAQIAQEAADAASDALAETVTP